MKHTIRFIALSAAFIGCHMTGYAQKDVYNQIASMEYKQWKFTPESYYYSWYKEKIDLGLFSIKIDVPGLGIHDRGPGGIGLGDNYVNEPWRMMSPLRATTVAESLLEARNTESEKDYWNKILVKDLTVTLDRSTNLPIVGAATVTEDEREEVSQQILDILFDITESDKDNKYDELVAGLRLEYDAIHEEVNLISNSNEDNSRRLRSLQDCNNRLRKLKDKVAVISSYLEVTNDPWMQGLSGVYPTSFRHKNK